MKRFLLSALAATALVAPAARAQYINPYMQQQYVNPYLEQQRRDEVSNLERKVRTLEHDLRMAQDELTAAQMNQFNYNHEVEELKYQLEQVTRIARAYRQAINELLEPDYQCEAFMDRPCDAIDELEESIQYVHARPIN